MHCILVPGFASRDHCSRGRLKLVRLTSAAALIAWVLIEPATRGYFSTEGRHRSVAMILQTGESKPLLVEPLLLLGAVTTGPYLVRPH